MIPCNVNPEALWVVLPMMALFGAVLFFASRSEKRRSAEIAKVAARMGLDFDAKENPDLKESMSFLNVIGKCKPAGDSPYCIRNVVRGEWKNDFILAFDYSNTYTTDRQARFGMSLYCAVLEASFPQLILADETALDKARQFFFKDDVDFESAEFSSRFKVRGSDRKFAYGFCHPRMMECLLKHRDLTIEINGTMLSVMIPRMILPNHLKEDIERLVEIKSLIPRYLLDR